MTITYAPEAIKNKHNPSGGADVGLQLPKVREVRERAMLWFWGYVLAEKHSIDLSEAFLVV